jgi:hypothetical protein
MEITFQEWTDLALNDDCLTDRSGKRKAFTVADDPLALAEIGLAEDARTRRMPPEMSAEYLHKYAVEGDSPKLRNEILEKAAEVSRGGT